MTQTLCIKRVEQIWVYSSSNLSPPGLNIGGTKVARHHFLGLLQEVLDRQLNHRLKV
jgi:hypothetical protein